MMEVTVRLFAVFRELAGRESLKLQTRAETARELFSEVSGLYDGLEFEAAALVAINDRMAQWEDAIEAGDEVLFFPPVAGG